MKCHDIPSSLVPDVWEAAVPFVSRALEYHPYLKAEGLLAQILAGRAQLILVTNGEGVVGAAVMEAIHYPPITVGNVVVLGGVRGFYRRYLDDVTDHLERWSVTHGCAKIGMLGRPGWAKYVTRRGWATQPVLAAWKDLRPA